MTEWSLEHGRRRADAVEEIGYSQSRVEVERGMTGWFAQGGTFSTVWGFEGGFAVEGGWCVSVALPALGPLAMPQGQEASPHHLPPNYPHCCLLIYETCCQGLLFQFLWQD